MSPGLSSIGRIHDVTMPIYNGMWRYRPGWESRVEILTSTAQGDASTVYRFDLCSHAGTYIETSQHKLNNDVTLDQFDVSTFLRSCKLVVVPANERQEICVEQFRNEIDRTGMTIATGDALIVATGWGEQHRVTDYLTQSPFFSPDLVDLLCEMNLSVLGVDIPAIDNPREPYRAVQKLFEANPMLLLLAPLVIDVGTVQSGEFYLSAAPLKIESVSASLCRALLIEATAQ
jgi:kynurenine formamidase